MLLCAALRIEQRRGHWKLPSHRRGLASWTSRAVGDQVSSREIPADVALHRSEGQPYAAAGGGEGGGEVPRERARGEQRGRRGQERGVGRREGALERVGVGEEGAEVVDGADEVVEVGAAELLDLGLPVPHRGTERGKQRLGAAARERPAHEGAQVLPAAMAADSCARSASDGAQADGQLQAPPSSLPSLSTGQLSQFPSQIASIASGRPLFPAPPSVPARFPAAGSISFRHSVSRAPPLFPAWGLTYGARLIQLDAQETPMDA